MKKLLFMLSALVSAAFAQAAQFDHWEINGDAMTDGEWTFTVSRRVAMDPVGDNVYQLYVQQCKGYPSSVTTLDFSKPLVNLTPNDPKNYAITQIETAFGALNGSSTEEGQKIGVLKLPSHEYEFKITGCFAQCANLVEVVPFLPSTCKSLSRACFMNCTSLVSSLVYSGSANFDPWEIFKNTAIPSADLSGSTITILDRECFSGCTSLKTIKFPQTLTTLQGGVDPFNGCTALELIEFNSVPNTLSKFSGCTSLKEVRFYHTAPTDVIPAGIYNQLNQDVTTYLILDDDETEAIAAWAALTAGGELTDASTWAQAYAGSAALMAKRPLLRFSVKHVSLAAGQDGGVISGCPGAFIVSRAEGDSLGGSVMVNYTIAGGTAEEGVHFEPLPGIVAIPSGEKSGIIKVPPKYFGYVGTETLTLKLAEGDYEIVEGEDEATISLSTESLRSVSIAKGEDADEGTGAVGSFILSRGEGDSVEGPVDVSLSFGGTAVAGQTYRAIKNVVTIPAGENTLKVKVVPYDDQTVTEDTTVEATILPGGYGIGTSSVTVTIVNGETYGGWKPVSAGAISDGNWTFTVSLRPNDKYDDGTYHVWVQGCTKWPDKTSKLDFGKAFHNSYNGKLYAFQRFQGTDMGLVVRSGETLAPTAAGEKVGSVGLPDDGYPYTIDGYTFANLPNLTSVEPFLPKSCDKVGQNAFGFLPDLVQKDLYFYGSDFGSAVGCWGIIESSTGITNVDLSASTVTVLRRDCFKNCTGLKVVKLPPTIQAFGAPDYGNLSLQNRTPFNGCTNVKLIFNGSTLPTILLEGLYASGEPSVSAMEFSSALTTLQDNAFKPYTNLAEIKFFGAKPETVGSDLFAGLTANQLTAYVPRSKVATWKPVATDGIITKTKGEWVSGMSQQIRTWADDHPGMMLIIR